MQILNNLCAGSAGYILDIVVIAAFLLVGGICAAKGFIECAFGIIATAVSLIVSVTLCKGVVSVTGGLFGLQGLFDTKFTGILSKLDGFNVDLATLGEAEAALKAEDISAVVAKLVLKMAGKTETLEAGTTLASMIGKATSKTAVIAIAAIALFLIVNVSLFVLKWLIKAKNGGGFNGGESNATSILDRLLGFAFGFVIVLFAVGLLLALLSVLPGEGIKNFLDNTIIVKYLCKFNPVVYLLSSFL